MELSSVIKAQWPRKKEECTILKQFTWFVNHDQISIGG